MMDIVKKINLRSDAAKGWVQLALVLVFIAGSFTLSAALQAHKDPLRPAKIDDRVLMVEAVQAQPQAHRIAFDLNGLISARADIALTPQVSGRIIAVNDNIFAGGAFSAGEFLFQIDSTDYQLAVKQLEATVAQAMTAYNLEEAESDIAAQEWAQLHGEDAAIPDLVARKPQLDEAWANLQSAKAQLEKATLDLERTVFSLPFDGRITSSDLAVGQHVTAGQSYGMAYNLSTLEIQASLDEQRLGWLLDARDPQIFIQARYRGERHHFKGVLKRGAAQLDSANRFAKIAVGFDSADMAARKASGALLPGVFADLSIQGPVIEELIKLPVSALQKGGMVWEIDPQDKTLRRQRADIVYNDGQHVFMRGFDRPALFVATKLAGGSDGMHVEYEMAKGR